MSLDIQQREREGIVILDLKGRITVGPEATAVREKLSALSAAGTTKTVLNLEQVDYIDSTGLGALVIVATSMRKIGGSVKLLNLNRRNIELLVMTKLATVFEIFADEQDAVNSYYPDRKTKTFDLLNFVQQMKKRNSRMALVVIGGNAAGMSAAARARRLDPRLEILVLEKGPTISYGACGLPYFVEGRVREARQLIVYTPEYFRKERNIQVRTGARAVAISHPRREVTLESGERVHYDHLVIATGARCDSLGIAGAAQPHVFTLHTLEDAERMRQFLREKQPKRAVVVGAGYIGVEAADALRRNGLRVTILERSQNILLRSDPAFAAAVRKQLEDHGVELRLGVAVTSIDLDRVGNVPCDMVVLSAGFKPNVELAADAGVEVGRTGAVRTDDHMETNLRGVYAAGDCAEVMHLVTGRPTYIPLGTSANKAGRVAGANVTGARERFPGIVGTSIVGIFGMAFATTGLSVDQARAEGFSPVSESIEAQARPRYFQGKKTTVELVADRTTHRLLGGWVTGEEGAAGRIDVIATALHSRLRVDDFEQLDLAYSPPFATVWDPLLVAAQQLLKKL